MYTIHLNNLQLFGRHGIYPEEQVLGGMFELNISCSFNHAGKVTALEETVDYSAVFELLKKKFAEPHGLLETLAADLAGAIYGSFPFLTGISVNIIKITPPIEAFNGSTGVTFTATYP